MEFKKLFEWWGSAQLLGIEDIARECVDGVARVRAGDLLQASDASAGLVGAAQVVHEDGVRPVGLDGGIAVVHALRAGDGAVHASGHVGHLVVRQPRLRHVGAVDVGSTCKVSM